MLHKTALFSKRLIICIQDHSCYHSNQKSPQTVKLTCQSRASQRTELQSTKGRRHPLLPSQAGEYQGNEERTKGITTPTPQATGSHSLGTTIWLWNHLLPQLRLELQTPEVLNQHLLIHWLRGSFASLHPRDKHVQWTLPRYISYMWSNTQNNSQVETLSTHLIYRRSADQPLSSWRWEQ